MLPLEGHRYSLVHLPIIANQAANNHLFIIGSWERSRIVARTYLARILLSPFSLEIPGPQALNASKVVSVPFPSNPKPQQIVVRPPHVVPASSSRKLSGRPGGPAGLRPQGFEVRI